MHVVKSDRSKSGQTAQARSLLMTGVELDRINRWNVYHRLQELNVLCECSCDRPLTVAINTPADALLVWSVVRAVTLPKPSLTDHLERCWQQRSPR
jgi:predicted metal-binding protein